MRLPRKGRPHGSSQYRKELSIAYSLHREHNQGNQRCHLPRSLLLQEQHQSKGVWMTVTLIMGQPAAEGMSLWTARQFYNLQLHPKGDEAERLIPHQNPEAMRRNCPMLVFQENRGGRKWPCSSSSQTSHAFIRWRTGHSDQTSVACVEICNVIRPSQQRYSST